MMTVSIISYTAEPRRKVNLNWTAIGIVLFYALCLLALFHSIDLDPQNGDFLVLGP